MLMFCLFLFSSLCVCQYTTDQNLFDDEIQSTFSPEIYPETTSTVEEDQSELYSAGQRNYYPDDDEYILLTEEETSSFPSLETEVGSYTEYTEYTNYTEYTEYIEYTEYTEYSLPSTETEESFTEYKNSYLEESEGDSYSYTENSEENYSYTLYTETSSLDDSYGPYSNDSGTYGLEDDSFSSSGYGGSRYSYDSYSLEESEDDSDSYYSNEESEYNRHTDDIYGLTSTEYEYLLQYWYGFGLPVGAGQYILAPNAANAGGYANYRDFWYYYDLYFHDVYEAISHNEYLGNLFNDIQDVHAYYINGYYNDQDSANYLLNQGCFECYQGSFQATVASSDQGGQAMLLETDSGNQIGSVIVPPELASSVGGYVYMEIQFVERDSSTNLLASSGKVGRTVMDILLRDDLGNEITELSSPMTICIEHRDDSDVQCLSFYNENSREWECEDKNPVKQGAEYCGKTDHLTSFALLLAGGEDGSSSYETLFAYLSIAFIAMAVLCVAIGIMLIERKFYVKRKKRRETLKRLARLTQSGDAPRF